MKQGFVKVAAVTPDLRVADVAYNTEKICEAIEEAAQERAKIVVFPELCITGYTCGDLYLQDALLKSVKSIYKLMRILIFQYLAESLQSVHKITSELYPIKSYIRA